MHEQAKSEKSRWTAMQSAAFSSRSAYQKAPHLRNTKLKKMIAETLHNLVVDIIRRKGSCRALDLGAGHGDFTDALLRANASVVVSEMSQSSVDELHRKYGTIAEVEVIYDPTGEEVFKRGDTYDLVACISLLHHVPDYSTFVRRVTDHLSDGGCFTSFQDPMLYATIGRPTRLLHRGSFYAWRLRQGNLRRGLQTTIRRLRGILDTSNPSDMVEYHVVRGGVDHRELLELLGERFSDVRLVTYWSTPSRTLQRLGEWLDLRSEFGLVAKDLRGARPKGR